MAAKAEALMASATVEETEEETGRGLTVTVDKATAAGGARLVVERMELAKMVVARTAAVI